MAEAVACDSVPTSVDRLALPTRTDGRTDGLTKNWETERTSGTFRNAHTRIPEFAAVEVADEPTVVPPDVLDRQKLDAAYAAIRDLGRQVRRLRAELEAQR